MEVELFFKRALAIYEKSLGPDHPNVARELNNLAGLYYATDRREEAEHLYQRALVVFAKFQRATSHEHPNFQLGRENYFFILKAMGMAEVEIQKRIDAILRGEAVEVIK